ncbi:sulfotransferase [Undibacterium sp. TJN19]|uniref:sulfotransferase n=1 Tax=Undibacterium sp. TJN19 TaxID=3413055 RepID=UPI003BF3E938
MAIEQGFAAEERALIRGRQVDYHTLPSMLNWFPVAMSVNAETLWWRYMGEERFLASFFQDSLAAQSYEQKQVCHTPLLALNDIIDKLDCVAPTAFIFHVSRCGSTLLTQMLASLNQCIVLSEPPVLDAFFRAYHAHPDMVDAGQIFRQIIAVMGQRRHADEKHFFIKFDCWHLPWLDFIRKVFPDLPCIFLYRQPVEVLASHQRQRGPQMIPGLVDTTRLRPDTAHLSPNDFDGYTAAMLSSLFRTGLDNLLPARLYLLNYAQLPGVVWQDLLVLFNIDCGSAQLLRMQTRSGLHSKNRHLSFTGDVSAMQTEDTMTVHAKLEQVNQIYEDLEKLRTGI